MEIPNCSRRVIKALAVDADGTSVLVTRFISPTPLPPILVEAASNPQSLARDAPLISLTELVMLKVWAQPYHENLEMRFLNLR